MGQEDGVRVAMGDAFFSAESMGEGVDVTDVGPGEAFPGLEGGFLHFPRGFFVHRVRIKAGEEGEDAGNRGQGVGLAFLGGTPSHDAFKGVGQSIETRRGDEARREAKDKRGG